MRTNHLLGLMLFIASLAPAQTGKVNGTIRGTVTDPSNSPIATAKITATNLDTNFSRQTNTNSRGEYEVPLLPIGPYRVEIAASGFTPYTQNGVTVEIDNASQVNVALQVGSSQQAITVNADASILNTLTFDVSGDVNQKSMENLPITSRNTFNLALFAPGLNGSRDDEFGNPTFAFGGMQRKAFLVDGVDNTQRGGPGRLGIFAPDSIQEIKVIENAMAAEYGRTVGGMISMVTRGGTNSLHGEALILERRPGLIARPALAGLKPFQQWAIFSGNLGGAIKKDKLFYFVSGEYEPEDGARPITISPSNAAALGIPQSDLGSAPFKQRFQTYLGRLDYQLNARNNFYFRYSNFDTPSKYNTSGGLSPRSAGNNFDDRNDTVAAEWTNIIAPNAVNELRFGFLRRKFTRPPVSGVVGPVIAISGVATIGSNTSANQSYTEDQFNFIDTASYRFGRHQIKLGLDVDTVHVISGDRLLLQYSFTNLTQYLNTLNHVTDPATGRPTNYTQLTQDFGNNVATHRTTPINLFAQDDFRLTPNFTLSYGLRYEYRVFPSLQNNAPLPISRQIPSDALNFAPRFGFAWNLNSKTVVRGGYGIFFDTLNLRLISLVDRQNGNQVLRYVISGSLPNAPVYPNTFPTADPAFVVKPSVDGFSTHFKTQNAQQANMQMEREVMRDLSVTVGTQWYGGHYQPLLVDTNLFAPPTFTADGRPRFSTTVRPNTAFNQILELQSVGNSVYYGGFVSLNKRFSNSFQFTASYTLGWAFNENDSVGDNGSAVFNPSNLHKDWAFSSSDQRHRFVFQGVWQPLLHADRMTNALLNGWTVSPDATVTSAFPLNLSAGSDINGDSTNNDQPLFHTRNDSRGFGFKEVNLRIGRTFPVYRERLRLELMGEAENLLNTTNASCSAGGCGGVGNTTNNFKQILATFNSRQIQLGARLRW